MHAADAPPPPSPVPDDAPWWTGLNRYQKLVLVAAALGWLFDTMDQQLFVLARNPALKSLLEAGADVGKYGGYATAIFMVGWATGGLIFGLFGDRLGRVRTMFITIVIYSLFTGLSALATAWWDFALYRFLCGLGVGGEFAAGVSLVAEAMPARARPYALALIQALSAVGNMIAAFIAIMLPPSELHLGWEGWRWMFLIGILPAALLAYFLTHLPEPDAWVKAREAMLEGKKKDEFHQQMGDIRDLFRHPTWRHHTIIGVTLAAAGVIGLWGVGFFTPELIRNNVLAGASDQDKDWYTSRGLLLQNLGAFFGIYGFGLIAGRLGRRPAFAIALTLALLATIMVFGFMTTSTQIYWMLPVLGFCNLMVFGGFAVYFPELYPTRLRSTGTGFCYNVARFVAAMAPFVLGGILIGIYTSADPIKAKAKLSDLSILSALGSTDNAFRYATLSVAMIYLVGIAVLRFAPETKGKPLPEEDFGPPTPSEAARMVVQLRTPEWLSNRDGRLQVGLNNHTWLVVFEGTPQYRLTVVPVQGLFSTAITQTINGKRLDEDELPSPTPQAALEQGLETLRTKLGW